MSYDPGAAYGAQSDYGFFLAAADANLDKMELVRVELEEEVEKVKQGRIEAKDLEVVKERILAELARNYDSNSSLAHYYVSNLAQLKTSGKLVNHGASITTVTPEDIQRTANRYLRNDSRVIVRSTPTLTFTQFYIGLGLCIMAVTVTGFYLLRRFVRRRRRGGRVKPRPCWQSTRVRR